MKIVVCAKRVPDSAAKIRPAADGKGIDPQGVEQVISPYDEIALACEISAATVKRELRTAKMWLLRELRREEQE